MLVLYGADVTASGIMQIAKGEQVETLTYKGIFQGSKKLGASDKTAGAIAGAVDLGISLSSDLPSLIRGAGRTAAKSSAKKGGSVTEGVTKLGTYELEITHGLTKSKNAFAKLKADIKLNGVKEPIKFVEHNGIKFVVDGHHRLRAAKELGIQNVPVEQVKLPYSGYKSIDDLIYSRY